MAEIDTPLIVSQWPEECPLPMMQYDVAVRLANEGVPVSVIARALRYQAQDVREALIDAKDSGQIVDVPASDWPSKGLKDERRPFDPPKHSDEDMLNACVRLYRLTRLQAALLVSMLKRPNADKEVLRKVIQDRRRPSNADKSDETNPKMVDVVICLMRKRLKPHNIDIQTLWGSGYFIDAGRRKEVRDEVNAFVNKSHIQ